MEDWGLESHHPKVHVVKTKRLCFSTQVLKFVFCISKWPIQLVRCYLKRVEGYIDNIY